MNPQIKEGLTAADKTILEAQPITSNHGFERHLPGVGG